MQDHELIPCRNWFDPSKVHHRVLMIPNVKHASPDVHFYHHKDINLLEHPGNVKWSNWYITWGVDHSLIRPSMSGQLLVRRLLISVKGMWILWIDWWRRRLLKIGGLKPHDDSYNPCQIRVPAESFRPTGQIVGHNTMDDNGFYALANDSFDTQLKYLASMQDLHVFRLTPPLTPQSAQQRAIAASGSSST